MRRHKGLRWLGGHAGQTCLAESDLIFPERRVLQLMPATFAAAAAAGVVVGAAAVADA